MRIIIIEDEIPAANRLTKMLQSITDELEVVKKIDSVEAAVKYPRVCREHRPYFHGHSTG